MKNFLSIVKNKNIQKKKRGAFTLIEIIIVIVLIAILVALFYPSITQNKNKSELSAVLNNDAKMIAGALTQWKADNQGNWSAVTTGAISIYLPKEMKYTGGYITSTGLHNGIHYQVLSDKINSNGDSFKIYIDFSAATAENKYGARIIQFGEKKAMTIFKHLAGANSSLTTEKSNARGLGSANADFKTGGNSSDSKCGVRNIVF